jgi:hypothetical protein
MKKGRIFTYLSMALLAATLVLLCAMSVTARVTGGVGVINAILKVSMYSVFGLSAVFFVISYIVEKGSKK